MAKEIWCLISQISSDFAVLILTMQMFSLLETILLNLAAGWLKWASGCFHSIQLGVSARNELVIFWNARSDAAR